MKSIIRLTIAALLLPIFTTRLMAAGDWHDNKYSMFIHFGIYSELGGVWDGEPVKWGYSEQIQSFAGIFSDWYAMTADSFDPVRFDADSIVSLAKDAGMKSIVFTSKHHDGFCMFDTETTDFNSADATPSGRDYVKELADACRKGGINFGLYFSIIDWHYPYAYPISSHNTDFITEQHHQLNKEQVTELLTRYGTISELWFDMGSQTPEQSRELYELVHRLQPECMVSGRVGNDFYDFAVMGDNKYPEGALHAPWQSAASMFDETWSYRSWQERGSMEEKADEKLRSLINVVSHGGNFLLNIGPRGDGSVVEFERDVLLRNGKWLKEHADAIYGTEASPFRENFTWGAVTRKGRKLYLILSGEYPENRIISLNMPGYKVRKCDVAYTQDKDMIDVYIPDKMKGIEVIRLILDKEIKPLPGPELKIKSGTLMYSGNSQPDYSYSCFDYYSNYRSTVAYNWAFKERTINRIEIEYTADEIGRTISLHTGNSIRTVSLSAEQEVKLRPVQDFSMTPLYYRYARGSVFDAPSTTKILGKEEYTAMTIAEDSLTTVKAKPFSNIIAVREITVEKDCIAILEATAGNGIEIFLNGESILKHLNPYRCTLRGEPVVLHLKKGTNQIMMRAYNRFEDQITFGLRLSDDNTLYRTTVVLDGFRCKDISISPKDLESEHKDSGLHNLMLRIR